MSVPGNRGPVTPERISNMSSSPQAPFVIQSPSNQLYRLLSGPGNLVILEPHDGLPTTSASNQMPRMITSMLGLSTANTNVSHIAPRAFTNHTQGVGDPTHNAQMDIPISAVQNWDETYPHLNSTSQPGITVPSFSPVNDETLLGADLYFDDGLADFEALNPVAVAPADTSGNDPTDLDAPQLPPE